MGANSYKLFIVVCFLLSTIWSLKLNILGAAYGKADVTSTVKQLVKGDSLHVQASNSVFGDPWYGTQKSLVIVYQYDNYRPIVSVIAENEKLSITPDYSDLQSWDPEGFDHVGILGAAYGLADVTERVRSLVSQDTAEISATNNVFGDSWYGTVKTLVVVYEDQPGHPQVEITIEGDYLDASILSPIFLPDLHIIKAAYGMTDVTETLRKTVHEQGGKRLTVDVSNSLFGDSWYGTQKSLVVVYQYGDDLPQIAVQKEYQRFSLSFGKRRQMGGL